MKKNKIKSIYKIIGIIFICFSFFANTTIIFSFFEYQNPGRVQTTICGYDTIDACNTELKSKCGNDTIGLCVPSSVQCNNESAVSPICPKKDVQNIDAQNTTTLKDTGYKLLAPIPGLEVAPKNLGDYINTILKIAIGLCAALAVIMIVIGGITYMGTESIFGKTEAKSQITKAILGLLIALGSYAILNTINPDFLNTNINVKPVSAEISEALITESSGLPALGTQLGTQCPGGYGNVTVGGQILMHTCNTISADVSKMIQDAKNAGINLSGASYRSSTEQLALRTKNCANAQTTPPNQCTPPTAIPGTSMHESGLAVDFKCDGTIIQTTDNKCFLWLQKNAASYGVGLKNLPSEPWHWSTTGS